MALRAGEASIASARMPCFRMIGLCDLALAVIDEQHRFGVHQRLACRAKDRRSLSS